MCSPVAGLFIEVLAGALFLTGRRKHAYILAASPPIVVGGTSLLFPFYGVQPFTWYFAALPLAAAVLVALLVPRSWRTLRTGSWVYSAGIVLTWAIPSPIGSNVERLSLLFGGTALLATAVGRTDRGRRTLVVFAAFAAVAVWQVAKPVTDLVNTAPVTATIEHAQGLIDELARVGADRGRVEVVPLRSHWEASGIAPHVNLARGWNRQADVERNPLFYDGTLTPATYLAWLQRWGVGYVVLPSDEPDGAAVAEAKIVAAGHAWLRPVWQDDHWRVCTAWPGPSRMADPPSVVRQAGTGRAGRRGSEGGPGAAAHPVVALAGDSGGGPTPITAVSPRTATGPGSYAPAPGTYRIGGRYALTRGHTLQEEPYPHPGGSGRALAPPALLFSPRRRAGGIFLHLASAYPGAPLAGFSVAVPVSPRARVGGRVRVRPPPATWRTVATGGYPAAMTVYSPAARSTKRKGRRPPVVTVSTTLPAASSSVTRASSTGRPPPARTVPRSTAPPASSTSWRVSRDGLDGDGQRGGAERGGAGGEGVLAGHQLGDDVAALASAAGGGDDLAVHVGEGDGGVPDRCAVRGPYPARQAPRAAEDDVQFDGPLADGHGDRLRLVAARRGDQDVRARAGRGQRVPPVLAAGARARSALR